MLTLSLAVGKVSYRACLSKNLPTLVKESPDRQVQQCALPYSGLYCAWRRASKSLSPYPDPVLRRVSRFNRESWSVDMMTLQASSRTGHYVAAVMPVIDTPNRSEYQVLVFRQGHEVYQQTERSLEDAIRTASAYLDRQNEQDFDS